MIARNVQQLTAYTPGEQPKVPGLIKLNTNENPYPPSPRVAEAIASFDASRMRLYPDPMATGVRERIARLNGCGIDQVFAGNGSDEVLALATRAFAEENTGVGYFDPSYSLYPVLANIRAASKRPVELGENFTWVTPPIDNSQLFFLTRPNAPTGAAYPKADVAAFCKAYDGVVLIDEAYADFSADNCMDLALAPDNRNVIVMRTLSKSFSLAGIRCGYAIGPAELIAALYKIKDSYNLDMLTQAVACAALDDVGYMRANAAKIIATRERLAATLRECGWKVCPSQANFLFASPPDGDAAKWFARLRENKILVRYFPGPRTGAFIRITIGTDEQIDALLGVVRA